MEKHCEYCNKPIEDYLRSTKKYCNDTCRRYAFYSRQGTTPNANDDELTPRKLALNGKPELALNANQSLPLNAKDELPLNATEANEKVVETPVVKENKKDPMRAYAWIDSSLIEAIDRNRLQSSAEQMFGAPQFYWSGWTIERVRWVTVRFRCLVDNILRLANFQVIDRSTVVKLSRAFNQLVLSPFFGDLPQNYPYLELIVQLRGKFKELAVDSTTDEITLRLGTERRAQLIAAKFMIGSFASKVSFHSLDFSGVPKPEPEQNDLEEDEEDAEINRQNVFNSDNHENQP